MTIWDAALLLPGGGDIEVMKNERERQRKRARKVTLECCENVVTLAFCGVLSGS